LRGRFLCHFERREKSFHAKFALLSVRLLNFLFVIADLNIEPNLL